MFYDVLKVGDKEYKLRLSTREMKNLKSSKWYYENVCVY